MGGSSVLALTSSREKDNTSSSPGISDIPWVQELQEKCIESLPPSSALRQEVEPVARILGVNQDHLVMSQLTSMSTATISSTPVLLFLSGSCLFGGNAFAVPVIAGNTAGPGIPVFLSAA